MSSYHSLLRKYNEYGLVFLYNQLVILDFIAVNKCNVSGLAWKCLGVPFNKFKERV